MLKKIGLLLTPLLILASFSVTIPGYAATVPPDVSDPLSELCRRTDPANGADDAQDTQICKINEETKTNADTKGILGKDGILKRVITLLSWLIGLLAAVFIIIGGLKFTTSGGNSDSVKSAKGMVIYACVGIVVVILSNVIINFVIGLANKATN